MRTLVWYRGKDLRIGDHAPLAEAAAAGEVIPVFVLDPFFFAPERARELPHRMQFLLESLGALERNLAARGSRLLVVGGKSVDVIVQLARELEVDRVVAQRWVEPFARERDRRVASVLDVPLELFEGETLWPPGSLRTGAGTPYAVFTHFARAFAGQAVIGRPSRALASLPALPPIPRAVEERTMAVPSCEELGIQRNPNLLPGGERAGRDRLKTFLADGLRDYHGERDRLDRPGTSRLSVDLKFGTLSPRSVWYEVERCGAGSPGARAFQNELVWREFTHSTLWDRPELLQQPFRADFRGFPWGFDEPSWRAWTLGKTGYPVVDAAARQLLEEGFVHNRARMIAASFLTKHLLIDYKRGEAHYMKYLTDGDWAQNNAGWQWSAGCGCDAQPYFRIFNPVTQGQKFDPDGDYVRRYVPELRELPARYIHQPWQAPPAVLAAAKLVLGRDYPEPIVVHGDARERFLALARDHLQRSA